MPASAAEGRHRVEVRARDDEHGAVLGTGERRDEQLEPDRKRKRLVGVRPSEGDELLGARKAGDHVAVGHRAHRDVDDDRAAVGRRDPDRERVRAGERRAAFGVRQPTWRGRGHHGDETGLGEAPHPAAERAGREAALGDDERRVLGRDARTVVADRRQRRGTRALRARPALVARRGRDALRARPRVERLLLEPGIREWPCPPCPPAPPRRSGRTTVAASVAERPSAPSRASASSRVTRPSVPRRGRPNNSLTTTPPS